MRKITLLLAFAAFLLTACEEKVAHELVIEETVSFDFPMASVPNTTQFSYKDGFGALMDKDGFSADKVREIKLTKAEISSPDGNLDAFKNVTIQMMTDDADMQQVATLNPIPEGQEKASLNIGQEAELAEIFKSEEIYFVIDAGVKEDLMGSLELTTKFTFTITAAQ